VPEASTEKVSARENSEAPTFPSYPTLELNPCDVQAFMPETDAASSQPDGGIDGCQGFEVWRLGVPAFLEPEGSTLPGYLTLEIGLNALGEVAPWKSSSNAASDEPCGKA